MNTDTVRVLTYMALKVLLEKGFVGAGAAPFLQGTPQRVKRITPAQPPEDGLRAPTS